MKKISLAILLTTGCIVSQAQNVGIGDTTPTSKLTIRSSDLFNNSLLVKNNNGDSILMIRGANHYMNGFAPFSSTLLLNNKTTLPFDNPQLTLMASGEAIPGVSNGSTNFINFRNLNSSRFYTIQSYSGAVNENFWYLHYTKNATQNVLLFFKENGNTGIGTFLPLGRLQVNHRSSLASPTLVLFDSSATGTPMINFQNNGAGRSWQIKARVDDAGTDEFSIANMNNPLTTLLNNGNFGVGTSTPFNRLHLSNNNTSNTYAQFTNAITGLNSTDGLHIGVNNANHSIIMNQESSRLYLGTAGNARMTISETGNVGIGIDPPTEKLEVVGNVKISGELNRSATGTANLLPIAYGNISAAASINSGSGNFSVSRISAGWYAITITGESFHLASYTAVITPATSNPIISTMGSGGGNLYVNTFNIAGVATDANFSFVVYKN